MTYIFGETEILREPKTVNLNCEYICVTDNKNLKSDVWKFIYDEEINESNLTPRQKAYKVKNLYLKYVTTNIVIRIDGSILPEEDCSEVVSNFIDNDYDIACMLHPYRDNVLTEYDCWTQTRNNKAIHKQQYIDYCKSIGFDENTKGLLESGFIIQKNDEKNRSFNESIYKTMVEVNNFEDQVEQIWFTLMLMRNMDNLKVHFLLPRQPINSVYFKIYQHGTQIRNINGPDFSKLSKEQRYFMIFNNKEVECHLI